MKLKVIKTIKSPYGVFANVGDIITFSGGVATSKHATMALPFYKKYTKILWLGLFSNPFIKS